MVPGFWGIEDIRQTTSCLQHRRTRIEPVTFNQIRKA